MAEGLMTFQMPYVPFPIIAAVVIGVAVHLALMLSSYGVIARGAGGNPKALSRAGWSMLKTKIVMYMLAGFFGVLSGLALLGLTTSGDAHVADRYTLYSIAGVILGGGEFIGGRVSPLGAVVGALTLALAGSFLIFLKISPDWQIGAQGAILIIVLALQGTRHLRGAEAMTAFLTRLARQPWIFSFAAAIAVWLITIIYTGGQGAGAILTAALSFATFTIIVGLGQMMVITTGPGNVDLSIPATITLSGVVAMKVMDEQSARMLLGIVAALGAATLAGIFNYGLIRLLRIPPIIATLSSSFLILSTAISYGRGIRIKPPEPLAEFATARLLGVPADDVRRAGAFRGDGPRAEAHALWAERAGHRTEQPCRLARRAERRAHALPHLCAERLPRGGLRHPALGLLARGGPQHGRGIPAGLDRHRGDRRHLGGGWPRQCARHLGRGALHVPPRHHAEHAGRQRRDQADPHRPPDHRRDRRCRRRGAALELAHRR